MRSDIRASFGSASGMPSGVPLKVNLTLVNTKSSCDLLVGHAVYVWHCDNQGRYSLYSSGITTENYLRGVQTSDTDGKVSFTTFFPACYSGRWPHIHFEIYPTLAEASSSSNKIATSQMAMPKDICDTVFATTAYSGSASNLTQVSLSTDMVFSDGYSLELPTFSGDATSGYVSNLTVGVEV